MGPRCCTIVVAAVLVCGSGARSVHSAPIKPRPVGPADRTSAAPPPTWYVAPDGDDAWSGRSARKSADGTDGPKATLAAAVRAARTLTGKPRRIVLAPGRYFVSETIVLTPADSDLTIEGAGMGKTILYGGVRVSGWKKDGDKFYAAELPGVKEGEWDFRALVVDGRLCPRARLPSNGRFRHESKFPVRWMSTAGGGWERKPTREELTTMRYRKGDLGPWLNVHNAEVTVYHMWDESTVRVKAIDPTTRTVTFASPCTHPPGAFGVDTYVVWNVRQGMTRPGQWYLDRERGCVVYWPLPGEDIQKVLSVAPKVESILFMNSNREHPVHDVTIRNLTLSTTTTPPQSGGFGAFRFKGAVMFSHGRRIRITEVEIRNVAGYAIREWYSREVTIEGCHIHHLGAGGVRLGAGTGVVRRNHIHDVGLMYPSAVALSVGGGNGTYTVRRNIIHDTTYSGMTVGGGRSVVIEENLLYRCMLELHDGAAIYVGGARNAVIRRNVVRDIIQHGKGYGVSAYYLDEKCVGCVVERNVSIGVARPTHNHMTRDCALRDNVFIADGDMTLSFPRSAGFRVEGNVFHLNGDVKINDPDAISLWRNNLIVQSGGKAPALSDAMPTPAEVKVRKKPRYATVIRVDRAPTIDGRIDGGEWPPGGVAIRERPDQHATRGAPVMAKFCADSANLYVAVKTVCMFPNQRRLGRTWGTDEGVELVLQGKRADGSAVTWVLRGFADGHMDSSTDGGATPEEARQAAREIRYAAHAGPKVWECEWRVPFDLLRFHPYQGAVLPANVTVWRSEDREFVEWAGTLGETWDLRYGGRLVFRDGFPAKQ